jgi:adenosine deaminase CECR1
MIEEKIMYAELRPMLLDKFIPGNDGEKKLSNKQQMQLIVEGVQAKQAELEELGQGDKFPFGLKIIYCTPRSIPKKMMINEMKDCIDLKIDFPNLICGEYRQIPLKALLIGVSRVRSCRSRRSSQ